MHLSDNTKAVLLLTINWSKSSDYMKPMGPVEFSDLHEKLRKNSLEPADLITGSSSLFNNLDSGDAFRNSRIESLLKMGASMALRLEGWLNNGLWAVSVCDDEYPDRLKRNLGRHAPPILFGFGSIDILQEGGIGVAGSRDLDPELGQIAEQLGESAADSDINIISGGARGADQLAMFGALNSGGKSVGVLAADMIRSAVSSSNREMLESGKLTLITPYRPDSRFTVGNAMGRNRIIYGLSDCTVIIQTSDGTGGTWAGAVENLNKWHVPMYVIDDSRFSGNRKLLSMGAKPLPSDAIQNASILLEKEIPEKPERKHEEGQTDPTQLSLFPN